LWALIAGKHVEIAAWTGAAISTLLSGITLYQRSFGPERYLEDSQELYEDVGEYLARLVSAGRFNGSTFENMQQNSKDASGK